MLRYLSRRKVRPATEALTPASPFRCALLVLLCLLQLAAGDTRVNLYTEATSPSRVSPVLFTATFERPVQGFIASDVSVVNGRVENFGKDSPGIYTFSVVPSSTVTTMVVNLPAGVATDLLGDKSLASNTVTIEHDAEVPRVVLSTTASNPGRSSPISCTADFSEPVLGFGLGSLSIHSGVASNFVQRSNTKFTFLVTPTASSVTVRVNVRAGQVVDHAGNANAPALELALVYDRDPPRVQFHSLVASPGSLSPIPVAVVFDEPVTQFGELGIAVTNASVQNFVQHSNQKFVFTLLPASSSCILTLTVLGGVAIDAAGNKNLPASTEIIHDSVAPTVKLGTTRSQTNEAPIVAGAMFSEAVKIFQVGDIHVTNGTAVKLTTSLTSRGEQLFSFEIIPFSSSAVVSLKLKGGITTDAAGNPSMPSETLTIHYDATPPVVASLKSSARSPTTQSPIPVLVVWSKPVNGFTLDNVVIGNALALNFVRVSDIEYTFDLKPLSTTSLITVSISGSAVMDNFGNWNRESPTLEILYDTDAPVALLATTATSPVASSPIPFTVNFGEAVTGFDVDDIIVVGGSAYGLTAISSSNFTFLVAPASSSTDVSVQIATGAAIDVVDFPSRGSFRVSLFYDADVPLLQLSSQLSSPSSLSPIPVSAVFSKNVEGFMADKIIVREGMLTNFQRVSASHYKFDIVPMSKFVQISVDVNSNTARDVSGNWNNNASTFVFVHDMVKPTVTVTAIGVLNKLTSMSPITVVVEFSEPVVAFAVGKVALLGPGQIKDFVSESATKYRFSLVPMSIFAQLEVTIAGGVAFDRAGNANIAPAPLVVVHDSAPPIVSRLVSPLRSPSSSALIPVFLEWFEPVRELLPTDLIVAGASIQNFRLVTSIKYTFELVPAAAGILVSVMVPAGVTSDYAGNPNLESEVLSIVHDSTLPAVNILRTVGEVPFVKSPVQLEVGFTEPVPSFVGRNIWSTGAIISNFVAVNSSFYRFEATPITSKSEVKIAIQAAVCTDLAGNPNVGSSLLNFTYVSEAPSVLRLSLPLGGYTNATAIPVRVVFSEAVSSPSADGLSVTGGFTKSVAFVSPSVFDFIVIPSARDEMITVIVRTGAVKGAGGQPSLASARLMFKHDLVPPEVTKLQVVGKAVTSSAGVPLLVTFSEEVVGFSQTSISVSSAIVGDLVQVNSMQFSFNVYPIVPDSARIEVRILLGSFRDMAGNANRQAASSLFLEHDQDAPTVKLSLPLDFSSKSVQNSILVTVTFDKPVYGFSDHLADIVITNAIADKIVPLDNSGRVYTFLATPWPASSKLTVTVDIPAGVCQDAAGNENLRAVAPLVIAHDSAKPTVLSISSSLPMPTMSSPIPVTILFSEPVQGFSTSGVIVSGANKQPTFPDDSYRTEFVMEITPLASSVNINVQVLSNSVLDRAGNYNSEGAEASFGYDTVAPTVRLLSSTTGRTTEAPIAVTALFSEDVWDFGVDSLRITGGVVGNIVVVSQRSYNFTIAPMGDRSGAAAISIAVRRRAVSDLAGNPNVGSQELEFTFAPSPGASPLLVTVSSPVPGPISTGSIIVVIEWNLPVVGFQLGDVLVIGGSPFDWAVESDTRFRFQVTPIGTVGSVTVEVPDGAASYEGQRNKWRSNQLLVAFDMQPPNVRLFTPVSTSRPSNVSPIAFVAEFSKAVRGFNVSGVRVDGGIASNFSAVEGSVGTVYSFHVIPQSSAVTIAVSVQKQAAVDRAGSGSIRSSNVVIQYDSVSPRVALESSAMSGSFAVTITFDKAVDGLKQSDVFVSGGIITSFVSRSQSIYLAQIMPASSKSVVDVQVFAGVTKDLAGNPNLASASLTLVVDKERPEVVSIFTTLAGTINTAKFAVSVVFSNSVTFLLTSVQIVGGTAVGRAVSSESGRKFTFDIEAAFGVTAITIQVPAGSISNLSGNTNTKVALFTVAYDRIQPFVKSIQASIALPTADDTIPVNITLNEPCSDFSLGALQLAGGRIVSFEQQSPTVYMLELAPSSSMGAIVVQVVAASFTDAAGNANLPSSPVDFTFAYNSEPPRIQSLTTAVASPTARGVIPISIKWTTAVVDFMKRSVSVFGGTVENFEQISASLYSADIVPSSPTAPQTITIKVPGSEVQSMAGLWNVVSMDLVIEFDPNPPTVTLLRASADASSMESPIRIEARLTKPVRGFVSGSLSVTGGYVRDFKLVTATSYTFVIVPLYASILITVGVDGGEFFDIGGVANTVAESLNFMHDTIAPVVQSLLAGRSSPTNISPIAVTAIFDGDVSNFDGKSLVVHGAELQRNTFVQVSSSTYIFYLLPTGAASTVRVVIPANAANDAAGNGNAASEYLLIDYDTAAPEVTSLQLVSWSKSAPVIFALYWSEAVNGLSSDLIRLKGGTITRFIQIEQVASKGTKYVFDVLPTSSASDLNLSIPQGATVDLAGNPSVASRDFVFNYDEEPLKVHSLLSVGGSPALEDPVVIRTVFNKAVRDFNLDSLMIAGGVALSVKSESDQIFLVTVKPDSDEVDMIISIPTDRVHDASGRGNSASEDFVVRFDQVEPRVRIVTVFADPTVESPVEVNVIFSEPVLFFTATSLLVTGASISSFVVISDSEYLVKVLPSSNSGAITMTVPQGVALDAAGHSNQASAPFKIDFDTVRPRVKSLTTTSAITVSSPIPITVTFTEPVLRFEKTDLTVRGGVIASFRAIDPEQTVFMADVLPSSSTANISVTIDAGVCADRAGNSNEASVPFYVMYDTDFPRVAEVKCGARDPTNETPIDCTLLWTEPIERFSLRDMIMTGGTPSVLTQDEDRTIYRFNVIPASSSVTIQLNIPGGRCTDLAGNPNVAFLQIVSVFDADRPTVLSLSTDVVSPSSTTPIPVTIVFSEPVRVMDASRLTVIGGTAGQLYGVSTSMYTVEITPNDVSTSISVQLLAGVVQDLAGNDNMASATLQLEYDGEMPVVQVLSTSLPSPVSSSRVPVAVVFAEPVFGFTLDGVSVSGGAAVSFQSLSAERYTFEVVPNITFGLIVVSIKGKAVRDAAGNANLNSKALQIVYDAIMPTVVLHSALPSQPTRLNPVSVTAVFSEEMSSFGIEDIAVDFGTAYNLLWVPPLNYTFDVTPSTSSAVVVIQIEAGVLVDLAGNYNTASAPLAFTHDSVRPGVIILSTSIVSPTQLNVFPFLVTFTEAVVDFTASDIFVMGGFAENVVAVSPSHYKFDVRPSYPSVTLKVEIKGGVVSDIAGNINTPSLSVFVVHDSAAPKCTFDTSAESPTSIAPVPVTVRWDEVVEGFTIDGLFITGGMPNNFLKISAMEYTFEVMPLSSSVTITVDVRAAAARDDAGNFNVATDESIRLIVVHDSDELVVRQLSTSLPLPTSASKIPVTVSFSKVVADFELRTIVVENATAVNFVAVSGGKFTFDVIPDKITAIISITIPAGVVSDGAGNTNQGSSSLLIPFDSEGPSVVSFRALVKNPSATFPIPMLVQFSEPVTTFDLDSLVVHNGTASNGYMVDAITLSFNVVPTSVMALVTVQIPRGAVKDYAGNMNASPASVTVLHDSTPPTIKLSSSVDAKPSGTERYPITAHFSELVFDFSADSIFIDNGLLENLRINQKPNQPSALWTATFEVVPRTATETIRVYVPSGTLVDVAGNSNFESNTLIFVHDSSLLRVAKLEATVALPTNVSPVHLRVLFSDAVFDFEAGSILVRNGKVTYFAPVSDNEYIFHLTPVGKYANMSVSIPGGAVRDWAGNRNIASDMLAVVYDAVSPIITNLSGPTLSPTKTVPIPFEIMFSKAVFDFSPAGVSVAGGTISNYRAKESSENRVYIIYVTPTTDMGVVTVSVGARTVKDAAMNVNEAFSNEVAVVYDSGMPRPQLVTFGGLDSVLSNLPISVTVIFNEVVNGFDVSGVIITGGTIASFAPVSTTQYKLDVTPLFSSVAMTVEVPAGVAFDSAGNYNVASGLLKLVYDVEAPTVMVVPEAPSKSQPIRLKLQFSEEVVGFLASDLVVENAAISSFTVESGSLYIAVLKQRSPDSVVRVSVPDGAAFDKAGFVNVASYPVTIIYGNVYTDCGTIGGSVTIGGRNIADFKHCFTISGDVVIDAALPARSLHLPALERVHGSLRVMGHQTLTDFQGLPLLRIVDGVLTIAMNARLTSLLGLQRLTSVGSLVIANCSRLESLRGLESLGTVEDHLVIENCPKLQSVASLCALAGAKTIRVQQTSSLCCKPLQELVKGFTQTGPLMTYRSTDASLITYASACQEVCPWPSEGQYCDKCRFASCGYGMCTSFENTYTCTCDEGYIGSDCNQLQSPDACISSPCHNGGVCSTLSTGGYSCECSAPFLGGQCLQVSKDGDAMTLVAVKTMSVSRLPSPSIASKMSNTLIVGADSMALINFFVPPRSTSDFNSALLRLHVANLPASTVGQSLTRLLDASWDLSTVTWDRRPAAPSATNDDFFRWTFADDDNNFVEVDVTSLVLPLGKMPLRLGFQLSQYGAGPTVNYLSDATADATLRPQLTLKRISAKVAPAVASIRFSDVSPDIILIAFDVTTDQAKFGLNAEEWCTALFTQETVKLLAGSGSQSPHCNWLDDMHLRVRAPGSELRPSGEVLLTFRSKSFKNFEQTSDYVFAKDTAYNVAPPVFSAIPVAALTGPSEHSECVDLMLDAGNSLYLLGRQGTFQWTLDGTVMKERGSFVTLRAGMLLAGRTYRFEVRVTNVYGRSDVASLMVRVVSMPIPTVTVLASPRVLARQDTTLRTVLDFSGCASSLVDVLKFNFQWRQELPTGTAPLTLADPFARDLFIPAGFLVPGETYAFSVTFSAQDELAGSFSTSAVTNFVVMAAPLLAIIAGSSRDVPPAPVLVLDASGSFDPDDPFRLRSSAWIFSWQCTHLPQTNVPETTCDAQAAGTRFTISGPESGASYHVSLTFTDRAGSERHSFDSVILRVGKTGQTFPLALLDVVTPYAHAGSPLRLRASVASSSSALLYEWNTYGSEIQSVKDTFSANLVLAPGILSEGTSHTFAVSIADSSTLAVGTAWRNLAVDMMPPAGAFSVNPRTGTALMTIFNVDCLGWVAADANGIFKYTYKYADASGQERLLASRLSTASTSFLLPAGNLTLIAEVTDYRGAIARIAVGVFVRPSMAPSKLCAVQDLMHGTARDTAQQNSRALLYLPHIAELLNEVTCSRSPAAARICLPGGTDARDLDRQLRGELLDLVARMQKQGFSSELKTQQLSLTIAALAAPLDPLRCNDGARDLVPYPKILKVLQDLVRGEHTLATAQHLTAALSNLLGDAEQACSMLRAVRSMTHDLLERTVDGLLAGDAAQTLVAANVELSMLRIMVGQAVTLRVPGLVAQFSAGSLGSSDKLENTLELDVFVERYRGNLHHCLADDEELAIGPYDNFVSDIFGLRALLPSNGLALESLMAPVDIFIAVNLPVSVRGCVLPILSCVAWNEDEGIWDDWQCETLEIKQREVHCRCSMLANVAVRVDTKAACAETKYSTVQHLGFLTFLLSYIVMGALSMVQLCRPHGRKNASTVMQHTLLLLICVFRFVACLHLSIAWHLSNASVVALNTTPQIFSYALLSFLLVEWVAVYHHMLGFDGSPTRLRRVLQVANAASVVALFMAYLAPASMATGLVGATVVGVVGLATSLSVVLVAPLKVYQLYKARVAGIHVLRALLLRLFYALFSAYLCAAIALIAWLVTLLGSEGLLSTGSAIHLCADLLSLAAVHVLLWQARRGKNIADDEVIVTPPETVDKETTPHKSAPLTYYNENHSPAKRRNGDQVPGLSGTSNSAYLSCSPRKLVMEGTKDKSRSSSEKKSTVSLSSRSEYLDEAQVALSELGSAMVNSNLSPRSGEEANDLGLESLDEATITSRSNGDIYGSNNVSNTVSPQRGLDAMGMEEIMSLDDTPAVSPQRDEETRLPPVYETDTMPPPRYYESHSPYGKGDDDHEHPPVTLR